MDSSVLTTYLTAEVCRSVRIMEHLARTAAVWDLNPESQLKGELNNLFKSCSHEGEVTDQDQTSHINVLHRDVCFVGPQMYP